MITQLFGCAATPSTARIVSLEDLCVSHHCPIKSPLPRNAITFIKKRNAHAPIADLLRAVKTSPRNSIAHCEIDVEESGATGALAAVYEEDLPALSILPLPQLSERVRDNLDALCADWLKQRDNKSIRSAAPRTWSMSARYPIFFDWLVQCEGFTHIRAISYQVPYASPSGVIRLMAVTSIWNSKVIKGARCVSNSAITIAVPKIDQTFTVWRSHSHNKQAKAV